MLRATFYVEIQRALFSLCPRAPRSRSADEALYAPGVTSPRVAFRPLLVRSLGARPRVALAAALFLFPFAAGACGEGATPAPRSAGSHDIVLCPPGSTFHAGEGRCVAEHPARIATIASASAASLAPPKPSAIEPQRPAAPTQDATVTVTCGFANGWVAVLPTSLYPKDDEFIMQALIGFAEEPTFWQNQTEYSALEPYKASKCDSHAVSIGAAEGEVFVLVGEADTFAKRNRYSRNGMLKKVTLKKGETLKVDVATKDLTRTFPCISCPWVHFESTGISTEPFVLLARRGSKEERGTDRKTVRVPVENGAVRVVVEEHEDETTYLDALEVRLGDTALAPLLPPHAPSARFALAADDGLEVVLPKGTRIEQRYVLPSGATIDGGMVTVTVSATGHYVPHAP